VQKSWVPALALQKNKKEWERKFKIKTVDMRMEKNRIMRAKERWGSFLLADFILSLINLSGAIPCLW
jgi:hypothetical protein